MSSSDLTALLEHRDFLRRIARTILIDPADIDDVEQATWRAAIAASDRKPFRAPRSWLRVAVRNHALNLLRGRTRVHAREEAAARRQVQEDASCIAERFETARHLVDAIQQLREPTRSTILLRYHDELPPRAIAARLGVPVATVDARLRRGLAQLRAALTAKFGGDAKRCRDALTAVVVAPGVGAAALKSMAKAAVLLVAAGGVAGAILLTAAPVDVEPAGGTRTDAFAAAPLAAAPIEESVAAVEPAAPALVVATEVRALAAPAPDETLTMRIGQGFVLSPDGHRFESARARADLYCRDIHGTVSLACPHGAAEALPPMSSIGLPESPAEAIELVDAAPLEMPATDLFVASACRPDRTGLGFVRARSGETYKVHLISVTNEADALEREAVLGLTLVEAREDGGALRLPVATGAPSDATSAAIRRASAIGGKIPGDSFSDSIEGDYSVIRDLLPETRLLESKHIVVPERLDTAIVLDSRGSVFAEAGIGPGGRVELNKYAAVGVIGPMHGTIDVNSYVYVYIDGPMLGMIRIESYATVVLEQDLFGTLKVRSYTDLLIRGQIRGTLDTENSGWCDFWFDGHYTQNDLAAMQGDFDQITLHVRTSDLMPGEHEGIGTWRKVVVGEKKWSELGK